jgi:hypothetical protein
MTYIENMPHRLLARAVRLAPWALLAGAAITVASPAAAQQAPVFSSSDSLSRAPTDTRYPGENYRKFDTQRNATPVVAGPMLYQSAVDFAKCVGRKHGDKLSSLLGMPQASDTETKAAQDLARSAGGCSKNRLEVGMRLLRGATAEALLSGMKMPLGLTDADFTAFHGAMPAAPASNASLQKVVECQVTTAPGMVRNLVDTKPGSAEADAASNQLATATRSCGSVAVSDPDTALIYRSFLAEGLYHLLDVAAKGAKS